MEVLACHCVTDSFELAGFDSVQGSLEARNLKGELTVGSSEFAGVTVYGGSAAADHHNTALITGIVGTGGAMPGAIIAVDGAAESSTTTISNVSVRALILPPAFECNRSRQIVLLLAGCAAC